MKEKTVAEGTGLLCRAGKDGGGTSVKIFRSTTDLTAVGEVMPGSIVEALGSPVKANGTSLVPIALQGVVELYLFNRAPDRRELILEVFRACDINQDGVLSAWEMFRLALCLEFPGTVQDWADEFRDLCRDYGVEPDKGFSEHAFTCCLNDTESYYYCSDEQLCSIRRMLPQVQQAAALKLSRIGLVSEVFRVCDENEDGRLGEEELGRVARCLGFSGQNSAWTSEYNMLCATLCAGSGIGGRAGMDLSAFRRLVSEASMQYYCTNAQLVSILAAINWDRALEMATRQAPASPGKAVIAAQKGASPPTGPPKSGHCICGNVWAPDMAFCPACGNARVTAPRDEEAVTCWRCNNSLAAGMAFCPKCGTNRPPTAKEREEAALKIERAERERQKRKQQELEAAGKSVEGRDQETEQPAQVLLELVAEKADKTLGFTPTWPPGAVIVERITSKGWAENAGIQPGAEIVEMDGEVVNAMEKKIFMKRMQQRPLKLKVKPPLPTVPQASQVATDQSALPSPESQGKDMKKDDRFASPSPPDKKEKKAQEKAQKEKEKQEKKERERQEKEKKAQEKERKAQEKKDKKAGGKVQASKSAQDEEALKREQSATKIQSAARGRQGRREANEIRAEKEKSNLEEKAAIKLEAAERGRAARKQARQLRDETAAATKLQAAERGRAARKQLREERTTEEKAAIKLEAAERGRQARKLAKELGEEQAKIAKAKPKAPNRWPAKSKASSKASPLLAVKKAPPRAAQERSLPLTGSAASVPKTGKAKAVAAQATAGKARATKVLPHASGPPGKLQTKAGTPGKAPTKAGTLPRASGPPASAAAPPASGQLQVAAPKATNDARTAEDDDLHF